MKIVENIKGKAGILSLLFSYLWKKRLYVLSVTLFFLILFGVLFLIVSSQSAPAPFIYTLF